VAGPGLAVIEIDACRIFIRACDASTFSVIVDWADARTEQQIVTKATAMGRQGPIMRHRNKRDRCLSTIAGSSV